MNAIEANFGRLRVFLPVIHPAHGAKGVFRAVEVARATGADGVFLINQGMTPREVLEVGGQVREQNPDFWLGVNLLGYEAGAAVRALPRGVFWGLWGDDCGADAGTEENRKRLREDYWRAVVDQEWYQPYFGGTAFKTQAPIPPSRWAEVTRLAARLCDVVTTSGSDTGVAAELDKVKGMRAALPHGALALASGITPDNVDPYLPHVDAYLVATGIESSFGVLDPEKTRDLAQKIHSYQPEAL